MVGVAVNVTLVPVHMTPLGLATIITLAGNAEPTAIVILLEVNGDPETHIALEVIIQVIMSPFAREEEV